jgi:hypothetical protein
MNHIVVSKKDRSAAMRKYEFSFIGNSKTAVVPILQRYQSGEYRLVGTGSYFLEPNIFLSAKHLFEGDDINEDDGFYSILEGNNDPIPFTAKWVHDESDIALLWLDQTGIHYLKDVSPLGVMYDRPIESEIVAICGYAHSLVDHVLTEDNENVFLQKVSLILRWEVGGTLEIHETGRGFIKGECFETSILAEGRDSGSPLFNSCGFLIGILSSSLSTTEGLPNSICTSILGLSDIILSGKPIKEQWNSAKRSAVCSIKKCANKCFNGTPNSTSARSSAR